MYDKVDSGLDFAAREEGILEFWKKNKIFEATEKKCREAKAAGKKSFSFYDGPPTANGKPHIGHILTRVMKDIIPRYKVMKGFSVLRKAGWDTHGLPVELEVEKKLKLNGKPDIEKYGMEAFIKECKESVWKYKTEWERMSERVGFFVDMKNPYVTYDDNYIESVWWSIKEFADKGLLYKGHRIVPYCPRCGTALSSHEVAQGYKDVRERSVFVKFALKRKPGTSFLAWTTTPWTLPSNAAVCLHPDYNYAEVEAEDGGKYILAEELIKNLFTEYKILSVKKGKEYEFTEYLPILDYPQNGGAAKKHYAVTDKYVTLDAGTGIVHIAPVFGEDDAAVGRRYGLPFVNMINDRGCFIEEADDIKGMFALDANKIIIKRLKSENKLFKELTIEHSYPFCWRCDTPLLYYARGSWFLKMSDKRAELVRNNAKVKWFPPAIGAGRMGNFLENAADWSLSRERYWGTPLPVWVCEKCGKTEVVGSKAELFKKAGRTIPELHRPYIDGLKWKCSCGGTMTRTPEVADCWYDSGSMPFAQYHYPFENKKTFAENFPADFISEAVDQTRGWFYTLTAISTVLFGTSPFKNCIVLGHVNDKDGVKMSKHKGNVVDPWEVLDKQGADAVRWYFYTASSPWQPSRFYGEAVSEAQRKFLGTLWNTYAFFTLYAEIDKFDPKKFKLKDLPLTAMDKWILSELNSLIGYVDKGLNKYLVTETARKIQDFTDLLSNWYVRRSRERFWGGGMEGDKAAAYATLYHALVTLAKLSAPFTPFIAESIYQNLAANIDKKSPRSVHLCGYPKPDKKYIDRALEEDMGRAAAVVNLGRTLRAELNIKNRQPLSRLYVITSGGEKFAPEYLDIISSELNVKTVDTTADAEKFCGYELKPQLKTLGPRYGASLNKIREYLSSCDAGAVVKAVSGGGVFAAVLDGVKVEFREEDLLISARNKGSYASKSHEGLTVVYDTALTEALLDEGCAREIVSKIQTLRKEKNFGVTDRIAVEYRAEGRAERVLRAFADAISADVLAVKISAETLPEDAGDTVSINGDTAVFRLTVCK